MIRTINQLYYSFKAWAFKQNAPYCPRCGGCGIPECCPLICIGGLFCAGYYSDRYKLDTRQILVTVLDDMNDQLEWERDNPEAEPDAQWASTKGAAIEWRGAR